MRFQKQIVALLIAIAFVVECHAQKYPADSLETKNPSRRFIKYTGGTFAIGNAASPTGWFGTAMISASSDYFDFYGGYGFDDKFKLHVGTGVHSNLKKKWCLFISTELVYAFKHKDTFKKPDSTEMKYKVSGGLIWNYGLGLIWEPKGWNDPSLKVAPFIKVGNRVLLSDYAITPENPDNYDDSDIDAMYTRFFKTRLYWNIGIRIDFTK